MVIAMRLIMMLCNVHLIGHRLTNLKTPLSILNDTYQTTGDNPQGTEIGVRMITLNNVSVFNIVLQKLLGMFNFAAIEESSG